MTLRAFLLGASALISCSSVTQADGPAPAPIQVTSVEFTATPAPTNAIEMSVPYTRSVAVLTLTDGSKKTFPLSYHVLHRSGDFVEGWYAGLVVDKIGQPILQSAADATGKVARGPFLSAGADGTSMLIIPNAKVDGVKGHTIFLVNQFEYVTTGMNVDSSKPPISLYAALPMSMNLTVLDQNPDTGTLAPIKLSNVDFSAVDGLWIPCNSSVTPWRTHLGSEEYEPDAQTFEKRPLDAMNSLSRNSREDRVSRAAPTPTVMVIWSK